MSYDTSNDDKLLDSPTKGIETANGELSKIFRRFLIDKEVGSFVWEKLMDYYLNDPTNNVPQNGRDRSSTRGNLNKALLYPKMTWKVFKIGLKFLGVLRFKIEIHATWKDGKTTINSQTVILSRDPEIFKSLPK